MCQSRAEEVSGPSARLYLLATTPPALRFPSRNMEITHCFLPVDPGTCSRASKGPEAQSRCYPATARWPKRDKRHESVQAVTLVSKQPCLSMEWPSRGSDDKEQKRKVPPRSQWSQSTVKWYKWQTPLPSALGEALSHEQQLQSSLSANPPIWSLDIGLQSTLGENQAQPFSFRQEKPRLRKDNRPCLKSAEYKG